MTTPSAREITEPDVAPAPRGPRPARRAAANAPEFAATEFMFTQVDEGAPAPRRASEEMLAAWSTTRWVEEQEAFAAAAARRAAAAAARRTPDFRSARLAARESARRRGSWLLRLEATLHRLLPAGFGTLLGLFLCVSLSMALISSMLPIVDRI
jgi:hypothetical protein